MPGLFPPRHQFFGHFLLQPHPTRATLTPPNPTRPPPPLGTAPRGWEKGRHVAGPQSFGQTQISLASFYFGSRLAKIRPGRSCRGGPPRCCGVTERHDPTWGGSGTQPCVPPTPKKNSFPLGLGFQGCVWHLRDGFVPRAWSSKQGLFRAPPSWGATRPGASHGRAPSPPHMVPTMVFCPSSDAAAQFFPPLRPLCVFLSLLGSPQAPRGSHSPLSALPVRSLFSPSLTSPTQLNFWGSDHHTKPHGPATGGAQLVPNIRCHRAVGTHGVTPISILGL